MSDVFVIVFFLSMSDMDRYPDIVYRWTQVYHTAWRTGKTKQYIMTGYHNGLEWLEILLLEGMRISPHVLRQFSEEDYPLQALTDEIIAAAVAVHRELGPGFLEKIYENALVIELESRGHKVDRQVGVEVSYRGELIGRHKIDLLVDDAVVVELKSVEALAATHKAQLRIALKAAGKRVGLLINFNVTSLVVGIKRFVL